jgi:type I restriction enzyme R subunit
MFFNDCLGNGLVDYLPILSGVVSFKTTKDIFQNELHNYTITNAIEDNNVLRFHIDYFQLDTADNPTQNRQIINQAIVKAIIKKHNASLRSGSC